MKKLFVYIDPGFLSKRGHFRNFAEKIQNYTIINNIDIKHYVNTSVDEKDVKELQLIKKFNYPAYLPDNISKTDITMRINDFKNILEDIFIEIQALSNNYDKIVIYMYTSHPLYIQIFAELNTKYAIVNSVIYLVLFYLDNHFCQGKEEKNYLNLLIETNEKIKNQKNLFICIDSDLAIVLYQPFFSIKIEPLPFPLYSKEYITNTTSKVQESKYTTIGFFGYAKYKYGFDQVCKLIKLLDPNKYCFILKINLKIFDEDLLTELQELKKLSNVKIYEEYTEEYYNLIKQCEIILLPYQTKHYPVQTSGVFIDSIVHNKTVFTSKNSWMAYKLDELGMGTSFSSIEELKNLIYRYKDFKANKRKRKKFIEFYTVEKLMHNIFNFKKNTLIFREKRFNNFNEYIQKLKAQKIEERERQIHVKDEWIAKQKEKLEQKEKQIRVKDEWIAKQKEKLEQKERQIHVKDEWIAKQKEKLEQKEKQICVKDEWIAKQKVILNKKEKILDTIYNAQKEVLKFNVIKTPKRKYGAYKNLIRIINETKS